MEDKSTIAVYSLIGVITVLLNSLEITLIVKRNEKLKTYEQLLLSLAVSDILVGISSVVYSSLTYHVNPVTNRQIFAFMVTFSFETSLSNLTLIGLDRLFAVRFPFKHRIWIQKRMILKAILGIWVFLGFEIALFAVLGLSNKKNMDGAVEFYRRTLPLIGLFSLFILCLLYGLICYFSLQAQKKSEMLFSNLDKKNSSKKGRLETDEEDHGIAMTSFSSMEKAHCAIHPYLAKGKNEAVQSMQNESFKKEGNMNIANETELVVMSSDGDNEIYIGKDIPVFVRDKEEIKEKGNKKRRNEKKPCRYCHEQRSLLITCSLVLACFMVCTLPFALETLLSDDRNHLNTEVLLVINSFLNPLIYFFKGFLNRKNSQLKDLRARRDLKGCNLHGNIH